MEARKNPLKRRSAPAFSHAKAITKLTSDRLFDTDLVKDPLTWELIRHPVAASDGRVHEAMSLLGYLQSGGRSPILREHIFSSVVYLLPLKNTLDRVYAENENRHADYKIAPVLEAIQGWVKLYNDKRDPIDLSAQNEIVSDDEDEPVQAELAAGPQVALPAVNNLPYQNTFLYSFLTRQGSGHRTFCLPPVSFWPRRLNQPAVNAGVNAFLFCEAILLLFAFVVHTDRRMNLSAIFNAGLMMSGTIAAVTCLAVEISHRR